MTQVSPLFPEPRGRREPQLGGSLDRQARRRREQVRAQTEEAVLFEQAEAFRASVVLTHAATLVSQAESQMRVAPSGREIYENILYGWANGATGRVSRGL